MNNADLAVEEMRKLQAYMFDRNASPNSIHTKSERVVLFINKASTQVNRYEDQLTRMLNVLQQKGALTSDILSAFTGAGMDEAEKIIKEMTKAEKAVKKKAKKKTVKKKSKK